MPCAREYVRAVRALCIADCVAPSSSPKCMVSSWSVADINVSRPCFFRSTRHISSTLPVTVRAGGAPGRGLPALRPNHDAKMAEQVPRGALPP